ncbi:MAG: CPBP family intramembrane glutamic endopeptidase [Cyanobacteria bacterium J06636_16]
MRRHLWTEVLIVALIGILPDLHRAFSTVLHPELRSLETPSSYLFGSLIVRAISVTAPVLYLIWRNKEKFSDFGIKKFAFLSDTALGTGLYIASYFAFVIIGMITVSLFPTVVQEASENAYYFPTHPEHLIGVLVFIVGVVLNSIAEEIVMRGYFIERLEYLLGSTAKSILLSSFLFALYHAYQGIIGTFNILLFGILYGVFYSRFRNIWPLVVAHSIQNFITFTSLMR